jgi:hypothetical protein
MSLRRRDFMMRRKTEIELEPLPASSIDDAMAQTHRLIEAGFARQALIQGFSILEAIGRIALVPRLAKLHTPGSVVETLTFDGLLDQEDADRLRKLSYVRNRIVHGDFSADVSSDDLAFLRRLLATLWYEVQHPEAAE